MRQSMSGPRKSAILLLSLPEEQAQAILARLDAEIAERIQSEFATLGEIDPQERMMVLEEYSAARTDLPPQESDDISAVSADPLHDWNALALAERLHDEHPQTIAALLSMTSSARSGECIGAFPVQKQIDVFCRMKAIRPLAPRVREDLLRALGASPKHHTIAEPSDKSRLLAQVLEAALNSGEAS